MNFEELSRRLLDNEPKDWPQALRELSFKTDANDGSASTESDTSSVPQRADARIQAAIKAAKEAAQESVWDSSKESKSGSSQKATAPKNRIWLRAAIFGVISAIGLYVLAGVLRSSDAGGRIEIARGTVELETGRFLENGSFVSEKKQTMDPNELFSSHKEFPIGARLTTKKHSFAQLAFLEGVRIRLGADTRLTFLPPLKPLASANSESSSRKVHLQLQGTLHYSSGRLPANVDFLVEAPTATLRVRGTEYLLKASERSTILAVHEGLVELTAKARPNRVLVKAGERATVDSSGNIHVRKQSFRDQLSRNLYTRSDKLFQEYGSGPLDSTLELGTEKEIKKYYGKIFVVILRDGREYTGYPSLSGDVIQIHTTYGVIEMDASEVSALRPLK